MIDRATSPQWDPAQYARFEAQRDRAALDLIRQIPEDLTPREIWDLGCGAGQHAALLRMRHPAAAVHGLDSSPEMIGKARALDAAIDWRVGDIDGWTPDRPVDLILANASLQWLECHDRLLPALVRNLSSGGVLAVQMPMAYETRHHGLLRQVAGEGPWAQVLAGASHLPPLPTPETYYDILSTGCDAIDIWSTTYLHVLTGENAVLEWMRGTALRPHLTALAGDPDLSRAFQDALGDALARAFPMRADGTTLLPSPRVFLTGRRR
ncbi:MAG: methyltransferase domain-containing protein [Brevundimonas sp.]|uniref:methyltransferase domain-containing protein n=1 Tax=Brevundimonas sp. TaxID=1871086 RepID=UPI0025C22364|nr:methyltransferase domain-containing protein [Brevundimonas sp.]MBX3476200.1 methyltransferase domain-containing protein [Brevundimonas sp.]